MYHNVKDSTGAERNFESSTTSYAVVADKYTETFEHNNLTDLFQWKTYGDAPWLITNKNAQTGSFSIQPGSLAGNQISTLEISIDIPSDSVIEFGLTTNTNLGYLEFYIDSSAIGYYYENNDWNFYTYNLPAGKHILRWEYRSFLGTNTANSPEIWLDNIFFPTNAILFTSIDSPENIPAAFNLFQNYPNPFNPSTNIKYSLAEQSLVKLTLYDILGRKIKDLFIGEQNAGSHEIKFNAADFSSGVYLYSIEADYSKGTFKNVKKMILLK